MFFFLLAVTTIWGSVLTHILLRTRSLLRLGGWFTACLAVFLYLGGFAYIPARIMVAQGVGESLACGMEYISAWIIGIESIAWSLLWLFELGVLLYWLVTRKRFKTVPQNSKRILGGTLWGLTLLLAVTGFIIARSAPQVTTVRMTVPGGEAGRFVFMADQHIGAISSPGQWRKVLTVAAEQKPDALLIPGDLIEDFSRHTEPQVAMVREFFPDTTVYITTGNHEFYAGIARFEKLCEKHGFSLLRQDSMKLSPGLTVAGIDDLHLIDAAEAVPKGLDGVSGPVILLTHRPAAAHRLGNRPMTLAIAGHTHGGQIPPMTFVVALGNGGFRSGRYKVGEADLYVTTGSGVWGPPMRLLAPPEIVVIETVPGDEFNIVTR